MEDLSQDVLPALICMPDLAGFTRFMSETSMEFSKKVIPRLLRSIVDANILDFRVSEIEGDAVLFYRPGPAPSLASIVDQGKKFYMDFGRTLDEIKKEYADTYSKHVSSSRLGVKIIMHYGEISLSDIAGITKLFGEDVIITHKLLKNKVEQKEYLLLTEKLVKQFNQEEVLSLFSSEAVLSNEEQYDHLGKIRYHYINLEHLYSVPG